MGEMNRTVSTMSTRSIVGLLLALLASSHTQTLPTDSAHWRKLAQAELDDALEVKWNTGVARNVVLFVGDGMGPNTVTAMRIAKGGEGHRLSFEKFPHMGLLKTYSANKIVPDSACTATALFTGVKANQDTAGVDATVKRGDCEASLNPQARPKSLAALALEANKSAGFVTTMSVTHATPTPIYAHSADRHWECESAMPPDSPCKDHARQLVEDWPGRDLNVVLGGGRQNLVYNVTETPEDPVNTWSCSRNDGRNLIETYKEMKTEKQAKYAVVSNSGELSNVNYDETDYLLGIFANSHLRYEHEKTKTPTGQPSLTEMVEAAIKILQKNKNGFFLMVEGGNIDMAHHRGKAKKAISEAAELDEAVQRALGMTDEKDTLIVVTADHTHTLSINGYPDRGSNVFGVTGPSRHDGVNYTTLSYGTGGPEAMHYYINENNSISRRAPGETDDFEYVQVAGVILDENSHGGGDVTIYARGPYAHLFHNVHEQHYVFHAISYAAKIGDYSSSSPASNGLQSIFLLLCICLSIISYR